MRSLVEFSDLSFAYLRSASVLNGLNLAIADGESLALLGPNGAGKTTLLRILCGRIFPQKGAVKISPEVSCKNGQLDLSKCGILLENPGVYPKLSIEEYLNFFAGFYPETGSKNRAGELCKTLGLLDLQKKMGELSVGMRQKVQIVRALQTGPRLLFLDEPVANLDPESRQIVWEILRKWKSEFGGTLVMSSHVLSEMDLVATSFAVLYQGKIVSKKRKEELRTNEALVRVRIPSGISLADFECAARSGKFLDAAKILSVEPAKASLEDFYKSSIHGAGEAL